MAGPAAPSDDFPWWLVIVALAILAASVIIARTDAYANVFGVMANGIWVTIWVTLVSYVLACLLGIVLAMGQMSRWLVLRQMARLYVEIMRGIPIIVLLLYISFAAIPGLIELWNWAAEWTGWPKGSGRDFPFVWRAIIALTLAYASFLAEVFRAGLQSVDRGQTEAAEALGLSRRQRFRHVVWPQAFRTVLPPLGNDFVAMIKDSSLVSVVGVADIAQLGKTFAAGNFRYLETYNVMALIYLTLTICLSLILRWWEQNLRKTDRR